MIFFFVYFRMFTWRLNFLMISVRSSAKNSGRASPGREGEGQTQRPTHRVDKASLSLVILGGSASCPSLRSSQLSQGSSAESFLPLFLRQDRRGAPSPTRRLAGSCTVFVHFVTADQLIH